MTSETAFMIELALKWLRVLTDWKRTDIMVSMDICGLPLFAESLFLPSNQRPLSYTAYGMG